MVWCSPQTGCPFKGNERNGLGSHAWWLSERKVALDKRHARGTLTVETLGACAAHSCNEGFPDWSGYTG